jgi:hypothetical protein
MILRATGFILLVIWTDMGLTKNLGDFETLAECQEAWKDQLACWKDELKTEDSKNKRWGQPVGFCIQGERLTAPGIIYPKAERNISGCG